MALSSLWDDSPSGANSRCMEGENSRGYELRMAYQQICGVYAAALTPRSIAGQLDLSAFRSVLEYLLGNGISSFALNGATGEYCLTTPEQLQILLQEARQIAGPKAILFSGVGAAGVAEAIRLAQIAEKNGANGLLLPMPYFFPYQQDDLEEFCRAVASSVELPILLYNLPQFTSGLKAETVARLIVEVPNIIGIKDSSGSLDILRHLTENKIAAARIVGNDGALAAALTEGVCDGVISGVACVLPELIQALFLAGSNSPTSLDFKHLREALQEVIFHLDPLPTPWGLKWLAEARGIARATFAQPVSARRLTQGQQLMEWIKIWRLSAVASAS